MCCLSGWMDLVPIAGALEGFLKLSSKSLKRPSNLLDVRSSTPLIGNLDCQTRKIPEMIRLHFHLG